MVTDNYYGSILMQVGIIPLAVFLAFLAALAKSFYKDFRTTNRGQEWALAVASFMFVVMIALDAAISSAMDSRAVAAALWTLLGLATAQTTPRQENSRALQP